MIGGKMGDYTVLIHENSNTEENDYTHGGFSDCKSAVGACKKIVDEFLSASYKQGMTSKELYGLYTVFGEDAYVVSTDKNCSFSSWDYAKTRCEALCKGVL